MDINQEIQKATDNFIAEKLPAMVGEKVGKMVDGILEDIFRGYSDTAKQIKAKIEEKLDINLQEFDLVDYNTIVSKAISDQLVGIVNENAVAPILELTKDALGFVKRKEMKLSEVHEMIVAAAKEDDFSEGSGEIAFFVEEDDKYEWHTVSFDIEKQKKASDCPISFLINKDGRIFSFSAGNYRTPKAPITPLRIAMLSRLEHQIFRLYSAQVKITVDETEFDTEWDSSYD